MNTELSPCPFCGLPPESGVVDATKVMGVYRLVHRCKVIPPFSMEASTPEALVEKWNTRAPDPRVKQLEEALRKAVAQLESHGFDGHACGADKLLNGGSNEPA